jgi:hypothetical protein
MSIKKRCRSVCYGCRCKLSVGHRGAHEAERPHDILRWVPRGKTMPAKRALKNG